jgi:hypothetical protein
MASAVLDADTHPSLSARAGAIDQATSIAKLHAVSLSGPLPSSV